jgi:hypothetical protein
MRQGILPKHLLHALAARRDTQKLTHPTPVTGQGNGDVRPRERDLFHHFADMPGFGRARAQELASGRHVEEEIAHLEPSADGGAERFRLGGAAGLHGQLEAGLLAPRPGEQREPADRSDARQRLAAEAERAQPRQVGEHSELAGRVPGQRQLCVLQAHAEAVVLNGNASDAAAVDRHVDARGLGVQRVLEQLFDDARWPLDHLSGGNLIGQLRRQNADRWHGRRL